MVVKIYLIIILVSFISIIQISCSRDNNKAELGIREYYNNKAFRSNEQLDILDLDIKSVYKTDTHVIWGETPKININLVIYSIKAKVSSGNILGEYMIFLNEQSEVVGGPPKEINKRQKELIKKEFAK